MRLLATLVALVAIGGHVMADESLVGKSIHSGEQGYFMEVYDYRPATLEFMGKQRLQGGGPTWRGLLMAALKLESPRSIGVLTFDDESDVLLVVSQSKDALLLAQSLVSRLMSDPAFMARCISQARADGILE
jgi:hypothetical protein